MTNGQQYSNRELDAKFNGLQEILETHLEALNKKADEIVTQTTKTNGRVNKLERWQSYLMGGGAVLAFIVTTLLAVLAIIAQNHHL